MMMMMNLKLREERRAMEMMIVMRDGSKKKKKTKKESGKEGQLGRKGVEGGPQVIDKVGWMFDADADADDVLGEVA